VQQHIGAGRETLGLALSASLWLKPPAQGTNIMAVGTTADTLQESWPAPLTISMAGTQLPGRLPHRIDAVGIECHARRFPHAAHSPLRPWCSRLKHVDVLNGALQRLVAGGVRMAYVHREAQPIPARYWASRAAVSNKAHVQRACSPCSAAAA